jgi:hypothetical protein
LEAVPISPALVNVALQPANATSATPLASAVVPPYCMEAKVKRVVCNRPDIGIAEDSFFIYNGSLVLGGALSLTGHAVQCNVTLSCNWGVGSVATTPLVIVNDTSATLQPDPGPAGDVRLDSGRGAVKVIAWVVCYHAPLLISIVCVLGIAAFCCRGARSWHRREYSLLAVGDDSA